MQIYLVVCILLLAIHVFPTSSSSLMYVRPSTCHTWFLSASCRLTNLRTCFSQSAFRIAVFVPCARTSSWIWSTDKHTPFTMLVYRLFNHLSFFRLFLSPRVHSPLPFIIKFKVNMKHIVLFESTAQHIQRKNAYLLKNIQIQKNEPSFFHKN